MARIVTQNSVALASGEIPAGTEVLTSYVGLRPKEFFVIYHGTYNVGRWGCEERQRKWGVAMYGASDVVTWFKTCKAALARADKLAAMEQLAQ